MEKSIKSQIRKKNLQHAQVSMLIDTCAVLFNTFQWFDFFHHEIIEDILLVSQHLSGSSSIVKTPTSLCLF